MLRTLPFRPFPLLANRHAQTIVASQVYLPLEPPSRTRLVQLPDGDQVALEVSTPGRWQADAATVILVHGLCGCHRSPYMMRLACKLWRRGVRVVRLNLRGCGSGKGLARQPYHSGRSEDVLAVLDDLRQATPQSPTTLLGFSLGGNMALKLAGELQAAAVTYLRQVIAVCPPADLAACARLLAQPANRLYERRFVRLLRADVLDRHAHFPDLPRVELPDSLSLYAFDNLYTAPQCGFRHADDYYARCSAAPLVPQITIPCHILFAADDPLIDVTVFHGVDLPPTVQIMYTTRGGHLGFLGIPGRPGGYRWMDTLLLEWIGVPHRQGLLWQPAVGNMP
jgi:predicted alpha/beta-fold hydrolase